MNDLMDLLKERRSIREFKDKKVSKEDVRKILEAGRWAPSSFNSQPWNFIVIRDWKKEVGESGSWSSPVSRSDFSIAIVSDEENELNAVNAGIAGQNIVLEAWSLGVGSCWIRGFDENKVKKILSVPSDKHVVALIAFGYPDENPSSSRKRLEKLVHWSDW